MSDYEELLRTALEQRAKASEQAVTDLNAVVTDAARAIDRVSGGRVKLVLNPMSIQHAHSDGAFTLELHTADEERVLRVIGLSETGYPLEVYPSVGNWDSGTRKMPNLDDRASVEATFRHMISSPDSDVVRLLAHILALKQHPVPATAAG